MCDPPYCCVGVSGLDELEHNPLLRPVETATLITSSTSNHIPILSSRSYIYTPRHKLGVQTERGRRRKGRGGSIIEEMKSEPEVGISIIKH